MKHKRPIEAEDLFRLRVPADPQLSPDGTRVLFVLRITDAEKNKYWSHLHVVDASGGDARPFTSGEVSDNAPRWSPDGTRIAFLRTKDKQTQLWTMPADGGEARPLTRLDEGDIGAPCWSPDGKRLAFTFRPAHPDFTQKAARARQESGRSTPARHLTRLHYREDGCGWKDCRQHINVCDAANGDVSQLTDGDEDDFDPAWSPDGRRLVFASNRCDDPEARPFEVDLWLVSATPLTPPATRFTRIPTPLGAKGNCAWSPNGKWIAYTGVASADDPWMPVHDRVWVVPAAGRGPRSAQKARCLTEGLDRGVGTLAMSDIHAGYGAGQAQWTGDSARLLFLAGDRGDAALYRVSLRGGKPIPVTGRGQVVTGFSAVNGHAAVVVTTPTQCGDIHLLMVPKGAGPGRRPRPARLTDLNAGLHAGVHLARPEEVWFPSADGTPIQAWLLKPPGFAPRRKYPFLLCVHGGPHLQYGNAFFHELQWHAGRGYVVLYPNPRGSANLTEAHMAASRGDWGGKDGEDLFAAAEYARNLSCVDRRRMGVCGGSYGGYATNWLVGRTNRFRCAITDRSVVNMVSMWGQCDYPSKPDAYWKGNTWDALETLIAQSPLTRAAHCVTPLLIVHSEGDWRCPIGQAQELFSALKQLRKCPVEFVWYPPETSHGMSRGGPPDLRLDRLRRYAEWFDRSLTK